MSEPTRITYAGSPARTTGAGPGLPPAALPPRIIAAVPLTGRLSPRESVIFELLGLGYGNRALARELGLSERTVKRHITAILAKLRLESRLQAGLAALLCSLSGELSICWPESRMDQSHIVGDTGY